MLEDFVFIHLYILSFFPFGNQGHVFDVSTRHRGTIRIDQLVIWDLNPNINLRAGSELS